MNINNLSEQFKTYKKWFNTLLMKEFFNLPFEKQKEFITIAEEFIQSCNRVHKEAKDITEKTFTIKIKDIIVQNSNKDKHLIIGEIEGKEIKIEFPSSEPVPKTGSSMSCLLYSIDNQTWCSSKTLLTKEV